MCIRMLWYVADVYNNIGNMYLDASSYDSALHYFRAALDVNRRIDNKRALAINYHNIGLCYLETERDGLGIPFFEEAAELFLANGDESLALHPQLALAASYRKDGRIYLAEKMALQVLEKSKQFQSKQIQIDAYESLKRIYESKNDYELAYKYGEKYHSLMDSLLDEKKNEQLVEMETKYETELKNEEIKSLKQAAEIQNLRQQRERYIGAAAILSVLIIGVVIYAVNKQRILRAERNEQMNKLKLVRSQINPHFFFNALTAIQNNLYTKKDIEGTSEYMAGFARLMRQTLESSIEELISLEEEVEMVNHYLNLQRTRNVSKFDFEIKVADDLEIDLIQIPPMLTQPFIENAVEHAFKGVDYKGLIELTYRTEGNGLIIEIQDNGIGLNKDKSNDHVSRATELTMERIKLLRRIHNHPCSFQIKDLNDQDSPKRGTSVIFTLPLIFDK